MRWRVRVAATDGLDEARQVTVTPTRSFSNALQLATLNAFILALPADAWLIAADHDEFFSFACALPTLLSTVGHDRLVCASMVDRLASSGGIEPLRAAPDSTPPRASHADHGASIARALHALS